MKFWVSVIIDKCPDDDDRGAMQEVMYAVEPRYFRGVTFDVAAGTTWIRTEVEARDHSDALTIAEGVCGRAAGLLDAFFDSFEVLSEKEHARRFEQRLINEGYDGQRL